MKAIILCAGKGTCLRPLTYTSAKHLIPLANKPALNMALRRLLNVGLKTLA